MRSWVLLLLLAALTAARLRLGSAEGDPLPPSLVELVRTSPISSVDDLKHLLQQETDFIEEEEDEHDILTNNTHGRYTRSLVEAQQAQQAVCKVRTEVMEVTRAMLDRRNANFMLWPPCVEVQRCSGCCNTRLLQCVPTVSSTRYLQVIKITFINKKAHYDNAIISVEDHVSCRCQTSSSPSSSSSSVPVPRSPAQANPNSPPPPPPSSPFLARPVHPAPPKSHASKADLHRHDDLKRNQQRYRVEEGEPAGRQWQQGRYTQLAHWTQPRAHPVPAHTLAGTHPQPGAHTPAHPIAGGYGQAGGWPSEARAEQGSNGGARPVPREGGHGSGFEGGREDGGARKAHSAEEVHHPDHAQRQKQLLQYHHQQQQQQYQQQQYQYRQQHQQYPQQPYQQYNHGPSVEDQELRTQYRLNGPQSDSASSPGNSTQPPNHKSEQNPSPPVPTNEKDSAIEVTNVNSQTDTEIKNQNQTETEVAINVKGNEREEAGSANSGDTATELANRKKDKDSEPTNGDRSFTREERRQKLLEIVQGEPDHQPHLRHHHPHPADHHHPQQRPKPTTIKIVVPTVAPSPSSPPRAQLRPALPRRRRKHRSRISKAAIRAMIM
ncbi:platelet-derived growth factor beta polypeptide a [Polymixia lowei]